MIRIFKTRMFSKSVKKLGLTDAILCEAVDEMQKGLIDGDLGGNVLKKRVSLPSQGKRGAIRTLVASKKGSRWFFLYGFPKNKRANITGRELEALQDITNDLLSLTKSQLEVLLVEEKLEEICNDKE